MGTGFASPVPKTVITCGLSGDESATVTEPPPTPRAEGTNEIVRLHCAPTSKVAPQVEVTLASPPGVMLAMFSSCLPILESVTVCAGLAVPTVCGGNTRLVVDRADCTPGGA